MGPGVSFYAFIPSVADVDERELCIISLLRAQCFLLQERKKEAETEREESKADAEVDVVLLIFLPRRIGKQCQLAEVPAINFQTTNHNRSSQVHSEPESTGFLIEPR